MASTIRDVARAAKVSVATVSRAINNQGSVSDAARVRIVEAAAALQYVPHGAARSLITRRTNTIGVLLPDLHGEFFSELIRGIDQSAREHGFHILVSSSHGDAGEAATALGTMRGRVDGVLVMSPHVDASTLGGSLPSSLPLVLMNTPVAGSVHPSIVIDNYDGAYAMVAHLAKQGHRSIALIGGPANNHDAIERERGYRDALAALLPSATPQVIPGAFTEESGFRAGQQLRAMDTRPDAVFASNDMMAIGCLFALAERGLRVPDDMALAGFDDVPVARYVSPPLTTVSVRIASLGQQAMERVLQVISANGDTSPATTQTVRTELVIRQSCARKTAAPAARS